MQDNGNKHCLSEQMDTHPFLIPTVLRCLFDKMDYAELKTVRSVCHLWSKVGMEFLRPRSLAIINGRRGFYEFLKDRGGFDSLHFLSVDNLTYGGVDTDELREMFGGYGRNVVRIRFRNPWSFGKYEDKSEFYTLLQDILQTWCPNLTELQVDPGSLPYRWPNTTMRPHMNLQKYAGPMCGNTNFLQFLKSCPKLHTLAINCQTAPYCRNYYFGCRCFGDMAKNGDGFSALTELSFVDYTPWQMLSFRSVYLPEICSTKRTPNLKTLDLELLTPEEHFGELVPNHLYYAESLEILRICIIVQGVRQNVQFSLSPRNYQTYFSLKELSVHFRNPSHLVSIADRLDSIVDCYPALRSFVFRVEGVNIGPTQPRPRLPTTAAYLFHSASRWGLQPHLNLRVIDICNDGAFDVEDVRLLATVFPCLSSVTLEGLTDCRPSPCLLEMALDAFKDSELLKSLTLVDQSDCLCRSCKRQRPKVTSVMKGLKHLSIFGKGMLPYVDNQWFHGMEGLEDLQLSGYTEGRGTESLFMMKKWIEKSEQTCRRFEWSTWQSPSFYKFKLSWDRVESGEFIITIPAGYHGCRWPEQVTILKVAKQDSGLKPNENVPSNPSCCYPPNCVIA